MDHILLILRSSVSGHLGFFHVLAVGIILLWTRVYKYPFKSLLSVFLGIDPETELLDHLRIPFLIFWGTTKMFLQQLHYFTFPPIVHKGSNFSDTWYFLVFVFVFNSSHPNGCGVVSHCGFDLHFSYDWQSLVFCLLITPRKSWEHRKECTDKKFLAIVPTSLLNKNLSFSPPKFHFHRLKGVIPEIPPFFWNLHQPLWYNTSLIRKLSQQFKCQEAISVD